jgi:hypothetical protein
MRSFFCIAALSAVTFTTAEELSAAQCTLKHARADAGCDALSNFAKCLASTSIGDPDRVSSEEVLVSAQANTPGCDITVAPSFSVVDREVREAMIFLGQLFDETSNSFVNLFSSFLTKRKSMRSSCDLPLFALTPVLFLWCASRIVLVAAPSCNPRRCQVLSVPPR